MELLRNKIFLNALFSHLYVSTTSALLGGKVMTILRAHSCKKLAVKNPGVEGPTRIFFQGAQNPSVRPTALSTTICFHKHSRPFVDKLRLRFTLRSSRRRRSSCRVTSPPPRNWYAELQDGVAVLPGDAGQLQK